VHCLRWAAQGSVVSVSTLSWLDPWCGTSFPELHVVPVPLVLLRKASPLGIFYAGVEKWGQSFCDEPLFEAYVGRQLQLLPGAMILPEIIYSKPERRSVDWFVILENLVLLVEVKSTRPSEQVRIGGPSAG
jgi:hypothetical protein